jgi:UDP-glucose:(heptosyl)LPS alpha-1,3-glucosyltransferase
VTLRVLHVVRRFGCVGGMEAYVWHLTHELAKLGLSVEVLCQSIEGDVDPRIVIHRLQPSPMKRRWKAMRDFRQKCDDFWRSYRKKDKVLVHSHERCSFHHVTTFHGPPIRNSAKVPWYKWLSPRERFWSRMEMSELKKGVVVPVSDVLGSELCRSYPNLKDNVLSAIQPGLRQVHGWKFEEPGPEIKCIFVGKEWRRKGLLKAVSIVAHANMLGRRISLTIFGPDPKGLSGLKLPSWVSIKGWCKTIDYQDYDCLIHPAQKEPFGMVVIEALDQGCRVLISNSVGASELCHPAKKVLNLLDPDASWYEALESVLGVRGEVNYKFRTWSDVASDYVTNVYSSDRYRSCCAL